MSVIPLDCSSVAIEMIRMIQSDIISLHKMSGSATSRSSGDAGVALEPPSYFAKKI